MAVSTSDYLKLTADQIAKWLPLPLASLGTDGYGLSDTRERLRNHFEVDDRYVVLAVLRMLQDRGEMQAEPVRAALQDLGIAPDKTAPIDGIRRAAKGQCQTLNTPPPASNARAKAQLEHE